MDKYKFIKNAITYFIGNVLTKLLAFLLIPLYTNYLSTSDYGYYDLTISIISLVIPITFFQIWDAMFRFIYDYKEKKEKDVIVSNGFFVAFISILIYILEVYICSKIFDIRNMNLIMIYGVLYGLQYMYGTISRTYEHNKLYSVSGVINTFINLVLNIILIKCIGIKIEALYISFSIGCVVQILIIELKLKPLKYFRIKHISKETIKKMMVFSLPLAISTISIWLLSGYAKLKISSELGLEYNGVFAIGTRFSSIIVLIISVLQMSWQEMSYSLMDDKQKYKYYEKGLQFFYNIIFCGIILAIPITQIVFKYFVSNDYYSAISIMPIIYIYTGLSCFAGFLGTQFLTEKNSKATFYSTVIAALINIILINLLLGRLLLIGVCISLTVAFLVNVLIRLYLLRNMYKINLDYKRVLISVLILVSYIFVYYIQIQIVNILMIIVSIIITISIFKKEIFNIYNKLIERWRRIR